MMHKCVDTAKKESSVVNVGQKQEQPPQEVQEQKGVRKVLPYGKKTFIHSLKYVLSTNQVSGKSKMMKRQPLPTKSVVGRETCAVVIRRKKPCSAWENAVFLLQLGG